MSERSMLVRLQADITGLRSGLAQARQEVQRTNQEISRAAATNKRDFTQLGMVAGAAGAAIGAGLAVAATAAADFDREMSAVAAVSGASAGELERLRQAAIDAGRDTAFSASQSAQAIGELTRAGVTTSQVLDGALTGALDLAAAGGLDLANAATIAAQSLNIFKLDGDEATRVADALAAGANKSAADVTTLGDALRQGGQVAAQTGLDLETTVGTLALFADNALVGSDAGTSFKTMLQRLTPQSEEAAALMDELGFSAFDAQGGFVGLESVAQQLQDQLGGLSDEQRNAALATLFGSDAVRAAAVLMDEGASGVREYTEAVTDQGAAAEMAAVMLDNLAGDVEEFSGSVETALIEYGENLDGILRQTVQWGTGMVNALAGLPEPLQNVALGIGGLASAAGLVGGGFLLAAPRIMETRNAIRMMREEMPRTIGALRSARSFLAGPWALGFAAAAGAVTVLSASLEEAEEQAAESIGEMVDSIDGGTTEIIAALERRADQVRRHASGLDVSINIPFVTSWQLTPEQRAAQGQLREIGDTIEEVKRAAIGDWFGGLARGVTDMIAAEQASRDFAEGISYAGAASMGAAIAIHETQRATREAAVAMATFTEAQQAQLASYAGFAGGTDSYQQALAQANEAAREHARQVAESTSSTADSWEDYFTETVADAGLYLQSLRDQAAAQEEWRTLVTTAQQAGLNDLAGQIIAAGPEHNDLYRALLLDGPLDQAEEAERLLEEQTRNNILGMAAVVDTHGYDFVDSLGQVGGDAVDAIAEQLGAAPDEVAAALAESEAVVRELEGRVADTWGHAGEAYVSAMNTKLRSGLIDASEMVANYASVLAGGTNPILTPRKDLG